MPDYRVADWRLDVAARELIAGPCRVRLEPLSLKFLLVLIENRGRVTPRHELIDRVWGRSVVTDDAFARQLGKLRAALAEHPSGEGAIETLPKTGLRLVAPVAPFEATLGPELPRRTWRLAAAVAALAAVAGGAAWLAFRPFASDGVQIRPFTSELGEEIEPALSPDGRWAVYAGRAADEERFGLYLRAVEGDGHRRLTPPTIGARRPAWSPSGAQIAFFGRSARGCEIMAGSPAPVRFRPVARCDSIDGGIAWLGEDRLIVADMAGYGVPFSLRLVELAGGRTRALTAPPAGTIGDSQPLASRDGSTVYFVRTFSPGVSRIVALEVVTGRITGALAQTASIGGLARGRSGRLLVAAIRPDGARGLWEVDPGGGQWREVAPVDGMWPSATDDGRTVLFEQSAVTGAVWMQRASAGQVRQLTRSTRFDRQPALAPDRRRIAFISDRHGPPELWLRDLPGGAERRALPGRRFTPVSLAWSPDSGRLVLSGRDSDGLGLFLLTLGTNRLERLPSRGTELDPSFSPDGRRLYFTRRAGRTFVIVERELGSGAERQIVADASRALPTADGRALLFVRPFEAGLWRLELGSGRIVRLSDSPRLDDRANWALAGDSVWVPDRRARRLVRLGVDDGVQRDSRPLPALASGLSATGDFLLYAERSPPETDLYLMRRGRD